MRPFELFLKWLEKVGGSWEAVVTFGVGRRGRDLSSLYFMLRMRMVRGEPAIIVGRKVISGENTLKAPTAVRRG